MSSSPFCQAKKQECVKFRAQTDIIFSFGINNCFMKLIQSGGILGVLSVWISILNCSSARRDSSVMAVFAGTTPCSNIIRPLHNIKPEADCPLEECHCILVE